MIKISLNKQIHIYSVDTSAFYNEKEQKIHNTLNRLYILRSKYNLRKKKLKKTKENEKTLQNLCENISKCNKLIKKVKTRLCVQFKKTKEVNETRQLNVQYLIDKNIVSVFDSTLTRVSNMKINQLTKDILIVQTYFFDVLEDIILNGFLLENEKYICFTASAGQIRTKKTVFIRESIWDEYKNTLTCGLTIDAINSLGGMNINKYLAYLALCNSATDKWVDFDISKTIVVEDFETLVSSQVDLIDEIDYKIHRKEMAIPIPHTDGCGMILPKLSQKSFMVRLPWVKGLLVPFAFDDFIREFSNHEEHKYCGIVEDIYGVEHDILKDGIEIIFTKSQFKMYKYYTSWKEYQNNFIAYNCQAGFCNVEEDIIKDAKLNYQMLQTLVDINDKELESISNRTRTEIKNISKDINVMLKVMGAIKSNSNKNSLQEALQLYPLLLGDTYSRQILKQIKKKMVKNAKAAKLRIKGKYTFLCPDLYAFCERLFLHIEKPNGLLKNGEVSCNLYKNDIKLDCLRSPHLFLEHCVRINTKTQMTSKWFITKGIYTSTHDVISKVLMFDVDGDKSLVCAEETVISVAERNVEKYKVVPLYYNMKKALPSIINGKSIFQGLQLAYSGGNIGLKSNDITKLLNCENINQSIVDNIKLLCMESNFVIDYAKTLYKPTRPKEMNKILTSFTKVKTPHFFIYAKDKTKDKVEKKNKSAVNRLETLIKDTVNRFKDEEFKDFDYTMLMNNRKLEKTEDSDKIIAKYRELDLKKHFMINKSDDSNKTGNIFYLYKDIRDKILEVNKDELFVVDVLVKYLYEEKKSSYKTTLWECFGETMVKNIKNNFYIDNGGKVKECENCGRLIIKKNNRTKYCNDCWKEEQKKLWKIASKKYRNSKSS